MCLAIFIISHVAYICLENKSFLTLEIILGIAFSFLARGNFEELHTFGFQFTYTLGSAVELFGIVIILLISELLSGRRLKMERNSIIIVMLGIIVALTSFPKYYNLDSVVLFGTILFLRSIVYNILKHILVANAGIIKLIIISSPIIFAMNALSYSSEHRTEVLKIQADVLVNKALSGILLAFMIANYFLDLYVFKYFDLDSVFLFKAGALLITLIINLHGL